MGPGPANACFLVIVATCVASYIGFTREAFYEKWMFSTEAVLRHRQPWRLITSGFVHVDVAHLVLNMVSLYSFGTEIERLFGVGLFLAVYFSAIVGGSLVSLVLHRHEEYRAVGASGGVCGILFAAIFLVPGGAVEIFFIPLPIPCWLFAIVFLAVSFFCLRSGRGRIGHDAHLGGAVVGLLVATAMYPEIVPASPVLFVAVIGLSMLMTIYLYKWPIGEGGRDAFTRVHWRDRYLRWAGQLQPRRAAMDEAELDRLLEKVSRSGTASLTRSEARRLAEISRRKSRGGRP